MTFEAVSLFGFNMGTPRPAVGQLILALAAGAIGSIIHALQSLEQFPFSYTGSSTMRSPSSGEKPRRLKPAARNTETGSALAAFIASRRFRLSWAIWYVSRIPIGALLGFVLFVSLRAGLVTADADVLSPHGIIAISALAGLFAKKALDKLRELFDTFFRTSAAVQETDPIVAATELAMIGQIDPSPVPGIASQQGDVTLSFHTSRDMVEVTHVRLDKTDLRAERVGSTNHPPEPNRSALHTRRARESKGLHSRLYDLCNAGTIPHRIRVGSLSYL